ncbi:hypothetical protein [Alteromonas sp. ASW11-130]|uniref:hypothetical protein n=1 Tax=Alteromonas sp. ASW11-130 TaxID=3015775 RepID=UPI0022428BBF|nr:hypothetical protein [Alteromonas sp. ASW11-130]MCW8090413.1 hypothetical protein [Alteromonas sp. ASW11-130]
MKVSEYEDRHFRGDDEALFLVTPLAVAEVFSTVTLLAIAEVLFPVTPAKAGASLLFAGIRKKALFYTLASRDGGRHFRGDDEVLFLVTPAKAGASQLFVGIQKKRFFTRSPRAMEIATFVAMTRFYSSSLPWRWRKFFLPSLS